MMEVAVTTGKACKCHHQQTITQRLTGRTTFLSPNQHCQSTENIVIIGVNLDASLSADLPYVISRFRSCRTTATTEFAQFGTKLFSRDQVDVEVVAIDEIPHILCNRVDFPHPVSGRWTKGVDGRPVEDDIDDGPCALKQEVD